MKKLIIAALCLTSTVQSFACIGGKGFLPQNDLYIADDQKGILGINQSDFDEVLDRVSDIYSAEIKKQGGTLKINRLWSDGTVNAKAWREGNTYVIEMYGGLARHSTITKDAFTLVACHEIGHHIGGAPLYSGAGMNWASTEGQSDYFATMKCMRKLFARDNNAQIVASMQIDPKVKNDCEEKHKDPNDQDICKRISMAGHASASMFAVLQGLAMPKFETPDANVVTQTYESHPQFQCRLDTYFNGAVCDVAEDVDFSRTDAKVGACNQSETVKFGFRPRCWFRPSGGGTVDPNPTGVAKTPTVNGQTSVTWTNPNALMTIAVDVSNFPKAAGLAVEISKPNVQFSNPNGTAPDTANHLFVQIYQQTKGTYRLMPAQQLPNWGTYQFRVIALDQNMRPVSKNSNSFTIRLQPKKKEVEPSFASSR